MFHFFKPNYSNNLEYSPARSGTLQPADFFRGPVGQSFSLASFGSSTNGQHFSNRISVDKRQQLMAEGRAKVSKM